MAAKNRRPYRTLRRGHKGPDVGRFQDGLNERLDHIPGGDRLKVRVDSEFGDATLRAWREVRKWIGFPLWLRPTVKAQAGVIGPHFRSKAAVRRAKRRRKAWNLPLRERAYQQSSALLGVVELGGNNSGPMVSKIIRANGGFGPEPWCGDAMAWCYRLAGSKAVTRAWAAVSLLLGVFGIRRTTKLERGDLVRFVFDHVGMFVGWCDPNGNIVRREIATHIKTREGNTGSTGAVSDSKTGGDGFYEKVRARSLVQDYLRVSR